jgi:hypothetical protein
LALLIRFNRPMQAISDFNISTILAFRHFQSALGSDFTNLVRWSRREDLEICLLLTKNVLGILMQRPPQCLLSGVT